LPCPENDWIVEKAVEQRSLSVASIRQNEIPDVLPDWRNLGVIARVLVIVNLAALGLALYSAGSLVEAVDRFAEDAAWLEPLLIASIALLAALSPQLGRLPYWAGCAAVLLLVLVLTAALAAVQLRLGLQAGSAWRSLALAALAVVLLLGYFRLLARGHSPALAEARLQALQARIRPHFLFNSLNAVLALIRRDPKRAERALEDLADLFRTLMSDAREFVRLADEIALIERYASLEQLRLGERLRFTWELDAAPADALLPPLVLQPLVENAVYHGVEPLAGTGEVLVRIERRGDRVLARVENPYDGAPQHRAGNRMALDNIRERLMLFFDAEARVASRSDDGRYLVEIDIPYKSERAPHAAQGGA
jgi:two-component system sensor histidine kinase AlgZ